MFDGELEFLLLCLVLLAVVVLVSWLIVTSSFGRVLTAIREDEQAIQVFGYQTTHYKSAIWVMSAMMAGLAGGLFSSWTSFIDPNSFILLESVLLVSIVDPWRTGVHLGVAAGSDGVRAAGRGDAVCAVPAHGVRRPGPAGGAGHHVGSVDAVPASRTGGEVQAMSAGPTKSQGPFAVETDKGLETLWRGQGGGRTEPFHSQEGNHQHRRAQRLGEVNLGQPAERDAAAGRGNGHPRRRGTQGGEGA